jgi:hypothetical protein
MKKAIIFFLSFGLVTAVTVLACNSGKGISTQMEGITELPLPAADRQVQRGKELIDRMNYSQSDIEAIAAYLHEHNK